MRFKGSPAKRPANHGLQATEKPMFAGAKGAVPGIQAAHAPSEPRRGQEAPPHARIVTGAARRHSPCGVSTRRAQPSQPAQRWRGRSSTPRPARSASQARSSGEAFIAVGKTRPDEPTKVSWPSPSHHARTCPGPKARMCGSRKPSAAP